MINGTIFSTTRSLEFQPSYFYTSIILLSAVSASKVRFEAVMELEMSPLTAAAPANKIEEPRPPKPTIAIDKGL